MRSIVEVAATDGPDKLIKLPPSNDLVRTGMHGALADFYGADPDAFVPAASTLDYFVASAACLTGTFRRALTSREVEFEDLTARATGTIVVDGHVPVIRRIEVGYRLRGTGPVQWEKIKRSHAVHAHACAISRSLEGGIEVTTTLDVI